MRRINWFGLVTLSGFIFTGCSDKDEDTNDTSTLESEAEPEAEPETEPESEPEAEPEDEPEAEPEAEPETEPEAEPETEPEPEEGDPTFTLNGDVNIINPTSYPTPTDATTEGMCVWLVDPVAAIATPGATVNAEGAVVDADGRYSLDVQLDPTSSGLASGLLVLVDDCEDATTDLAFPSMDGKTVTEVQELYDGMADDLYTAEWKAAVILNDTVNNALDPSVAAAWAAAHPDDPSTTDVDESSAAAPLAQSGMLIGTALRHIDSTGDTVSTTMPGFTAEMMTDVGPQMIFYGDNSVFECQSGWPESDCDGFSVDSAYLYWVGDGTCDSWFDCPDFNYDGGDCAEGTDPGTLDISYDGECDGFFSWTAIDGDHVPNEAFQSSGQGLFVVPGIQNAGEPGAPSSLLGQFNLYTPQVSVECTSDADCGDGFHCTYTYEGDWYWGDDPTRECAVPLACSGDAECSFNCGAEETSYDVGSCNTDTLTCEASCDGTTLPLWGGESDTMEMVSSPLLISTDDDGTVVPAPITLGISAGSAIFVEFDISLPEDY